MVQRKVSYVATFVCSLLALWVVPAFAQFTASIQGVVQDTSGASVAKAQINLINTATGGIQATASDSAGNYRFVSLAPGNYKISVVASGFSNAEAEVTLLTEQNANLPISLKVGSAKETVVVSTEAPIVDTADSRHRADPGE